MVLQAGVLCHGCAGFSKYSRFVDLLRQRLGTAPLVIAAAAVGPTEEEGRSDRGSSRRGGRSQSIPSYPSPLPNLMGYPWFPRLPRCITETVTHEKKEKKKQFFVMLGAYIVTRTLK